jgi:hypothetical protein
MKKNRLYIAILLIPAILIFLVVFQYMNEKSSNQVLGTIDVSDTYATISTIYQRKTFFANGNYWIFYCNGSRLLYATSLDGLNWNPPTVMSEGSSASAVSLWYDGNIHYALASGILGESVVYRKGTVIGNSVSWSDQKVAIQGIATCRYYNGFCIIDSEGRPWVSCICDDGISYTSQVARSNSTNGELWSQPMNLSSSSLPLRTTILPLPEARIFAIYVSEIKVEGRLWNGTAWQQVESITDQSPASDYGYSAVSLNDEVHLALLQNTTNNVLYYRRLTNGTWRETLIEAGQDTISFPVLSEDPSKNALYCIWIQDSGIQLRKRENESWIKVEIDNFALTSPTALSSFYEVNDGKIGLALLEKISQNYLAYRLRYYVLKNL